MSNTYKTESTIRTCVLCRTRTDAVWTWQPFGPEEDPRHAFTWPGNHYRGFPALTVCNECRFRIAGRQEELSFQYKGRRYLYSAATGEVKTCQPL